MEKLQLMQPESNSTPSDKRKEEGKKQIMKESDTQHSNSKEIPLDFGADKILCIDGLSPEF